MVNGGMESIDVVKVKTPWSSFTPLIVSLFELLAGGSLTSASVSDKNKCPCSDQPPCGHLWEHLAAGALPNRGRCGLRRRDRQRRRWRHVLRIRPGQDPQPVLRRRWLGLRERSEKLWTDQVLNTHALCCPTFWDFLATWREDIYYISSRIFPRKFIYLFTCLFSGDDVLSF